jgi:hypothetical protein
MKFKKLALQFYVSEPTNNIALRLMQIYVHLNIIKTDF